MEFPNLILPVGALYFMNTSFQYIHNLGVPSEWDFCDVFGTEPELLGMVPTPVLAVMLLYPINEKVSFRAINQPAGIILGRKFETFSHTFQRILIQI